MSNPYSAPDSDLDTASYSKAIPWLWSIYNAYVLFALAVQALFFMTGKTERLITGLLEAEPAMQNGMPLEQMVTGFLVFNYLLVVVMIAIGYLLVWRVNCRNRWALYVFCAYMVLWLLMGTDSFTTTLDLPGYEMGLLDYLANGIGILGDVLLFAWAIWGWRRFPPGHGRADLSA